MTASAYADSAALVRRTLQQLNELGVPHMLTGSLASNVHGRPRSTADADIVVEMEPATLQQLGRSLAPALLLDPQQSFESVTMSRRWRLEAPKSGFVVELFERQSDAFDVERFARRLPMEFDGVPTWVATAEDVVIQKLRWAVRGNRPKDIQDALDVLRVSGSSIDWGRTRRWCDAFGARDALESLRVQAGINA